MFQGSLALITYTEFIEAFNIWLMEYGNVGSWTNMVVRPTDYPRNYPQWEKVEKIYGFTENGELLYWKKGGVFSYDLGIPSSLNYTTTVFESLLFCN